MGISQSYEYIEDESGVIRPSASSSVSWGSADSSLHQVTALRTPLQTIVTDVKKTPAGWVGTISKKPLHGIFGGWWGDVEAISLPLVSTAVAAATNDDEFLDILQLQPEWMGQDKVIAAVSYFSTHRPTREQSLRLKTILQSKYPTFALEMYELSL